MPPGKKALRAAEVEALRDWINGGAKWETAASNAADLPGGRSESRSGLRSLSSEASNPIDAFILAKLEEKGLRPAPPADRRTLVRRLYFDLHGLPPTPEQVEQFVNDPARDA